VLEASDRLLVESGDPASPGLRDSVGPAPSEEALSQGVTALDGWLAKEALDRRQVLGAWSGLARLPVPESLVPDPDLPRDLLPGEAQIHAALGDLLAQRRGLGLIALWIGPRSPQGQMAKGQ